jgi:predicted ATPase
MQRETATDFLQQAEQYGDTGVLCVAHRILGTTLLAMGEFSIARMHLEKAHQLYDPDLHAELRFAFGQDIGVAASCYLCCALWHLGHLTASLDCARDALERATRLGHPHTLAYTLAHVRCLLGIIQHDPAHARGHAATIVAVCEEHGFAFWGAGGHIFDGWAAAQLGQADEGIRLLRGGLASWRKTGARLWLPLFLALEAEVHAAAGRDSAARQSIQEALSMCEETGEVWALPEVLRRKAAVIRASGDAGSAEAEHLLQQALAAARAKQARWWEVLVATDLAALWLEQARHLEARALLKSVLERFPDHKAGHLEHTVRLLQQASMPIDGATETARV